jgi:hypothetical protein
VRVGIEIAGDDEGLARADAARLPAVIHQPVSVAGLDVVTPQPDFIEVAVPVAVFRSVE